MAVTLRLDRQLSLRAPAKLNLGLEVLGRRADGYHQLVTILQAVDIVDVIRMTPADEPRYEPLPGELPQTDLLARALTLARDELGIELAAEVTLEKHIPVAAGLGGGSSDAGTLLGALGQLAGVPVDRAERAAAKLGSDVPFFVRGGTALATGTGTWLTPLLALPGVWFVVAVPDLRLPDKTRRLYAALRPADYSDGSQTLEQASRLRRGLPLDPSLLRNAFTRALMDFEPVRAACRALRESGAETVLPSGAGPALFATFASRQGAEAAARQLRQFVPRAFACAPLRPTAESSRSPDRHQ